MSEAEREKLLDLVQTLELKLNSIEQVRTKNKLLRTFRNFLSHSQGNLNQIFYFPSFAFFLLISLMKKSDEEQWSLKQKLIAFEVEKKSFEKEKEFLRNQIAIEQQKVQVI